MGQIILCFPSRLCIKRLCSGSKKGIIKERSSLLLLLNSCCNSFFFRFLCSRSVPFFWSFGVQMLILNHRVSSFGQAWDWTTHLVLLLQDFAKRGIGLTAKERALKRRLWIMKFIFSFNSANLQARILALNASYFLKAGGHFVISIKVRWANFWFLQFYTDLSSLGTCKRLEFAVDLCLL